MADRDAIHRLYEEAVQSPEREVELLAGLFRRRRGRDARSLREDFSGTAATSLAWVESDDDREAESVDRDPAVLALARRRRAALDLAEAERWSIVRADVRRRSERAFDLIAAMNFSWAVLDDDALVAYLRAAADSLEDDGLLVLEVFGGRDLPRAKTAHRHDGFTYVFEPRAFDPPWLEVALSFELDDGRDLPGAFTYRFRLRARAELEARLAEAGLVAPRLLVEDRRGRWITRPGEPRAPRWRALLVSAPAPRRPPGSRAGRARR